MGCWETLEAIDLLKYQNIGLRRLSQVGKLILYEVLLLLITCIYENNAFAIIATLLSPVVPLMKARGAIGNLVSL